MFANLFFLLLILMTMNMAPLHLGNAWESNWELGFIAGMGLYVGVLCLIYLQNKLVKRKRLLFLVNCELFVFFLIFHFYLGSSRLLLKIPYIGSSQTFLALFTLSLYFLALYVYHSTHFIRSEGKQLRFLIPFVLPFLFFSFLLDLLAIIPSPWLHTVLSGEANDFTAWAFLIIFSLAIILTALTFLPLVIRRIWQCKPLPASNLHERLLAFCKQLNFRNGGMLSWTVMNSSYTAAIIGIVPKFRYVMFTQNLLDRFPTEEVEAILAHEIGHNKHRHLLMFPFILMGMVITATWLSYYLNAFFFHFTNIGKVDELWEPILNFLPFVFFALLYFRFIFGYFSRLFERQADLYIFKTPLPAEYLISALDRLGVATGNTHDQPNWHHYGIQQRIDFLEKALKDPQIIARHHRKVRNSLILFFFLLSLFSILITFF
jgi:Zn-dependent protease with chaperone function